MTITGILLKASVLLAAAALAQLFLGERLSATSRHLLGPTAIVGLLALPLSRGLLPAWDVASVASPPAVEFAPTAEPEVMQPVSDVTSSVAAPAAAPGGTERASVRVPWSTIGAVLYGIAVVALLLRLATQRWSVRRLMRRATLLTDPVWTGLL